MTPRRHRRSLPVCSLHSGVSYPLHQAAVDQHWRRKDGWFVVTNRTFLLMYSARDKPSRFDLNRVTSSLKRLLFSTSPLNSCPVESSFSHDLYSTTIVVKSPSKSRGKPLPVRWCQDSPS
ncbi:hypothetical protein Bca4012_009982 [Brassica carinata]